MRYRDILFSLLQSYEISIMYSLISFVNFFPIFVKIYFTMKRVLSLLAFVLLLSGCDDGNLIQEDINFETATTQNCSSNDLIYKLNEKEALILEIPSTSFTTEPSSTNTPTEINISTSNRVVYRFYSGTVSTDNICETIPPATPNVTDQWNATAGIIQIITTAKKTTNTDENSTRISGYNHNIVFKNITFAKSSGTQVYETFAFGDYVTTATTLPFLFDETVEKCSSSNQIYNYTSSEALMLTIDPTLLVNEVTPLNTPRTGIIGTTTNILTYRLFSGLLTSAYFCNSTTPSTPVLSQEWSGVTGVTGTSGIIEVTTTTNGSSGFKHTIVLKKVTLKKGNNDFLLGDNFIYGELLTTN
jgi:PBP1b-binding outer membrane lipoprotein LpoB